MSSVGACRNWRAARTIVTGFIKGSCVLLAIVLVLIALTWRWYVHGDASARYTIYSKAATSPRSELADSRELSLEIHGPLIWLDYTHQLNDAENPQYPVGDPSDKWKIHFTLE